MAKDLKIYNHLQYQEKPLDESDGFVEFLLDNSQAEAPEVDLDIAWSQVSRKIEKRSSSFGWMKIAATISLLIVAGAILWLNNLPVSERLVSSTDQKVSVEFPDGSLGILNANSSFSFPEKFGSERTVGLTGEAYFDIVKNGKPFVIDANGVNVKVLGTAFNLLSNEKEVRLYVDHGLVAFEKDGVQTKVEAGKEAVFNKADYSVKIEKSISPNIMSWRNGIFRFDNTPLDEALSQLGEYYEVDFELSNDNLKNCKISATFDKQSLKEVLLTISTILEVKTSVIQNTVKISGKGC